MVPKRELPTAGDYYKYLNDYVIPEYYECAIRHDKLVEAVEQKNNK